MSTMDAVLGSPTALGLLSCGVFASLLSIVAAAWLGHTDESRSEAALFRAAIKACGWKEAYVAELLGMSEQRLSRALAGIEPLNLWRVSGLPKEFHERYDDLKARHRGARVFEPSDLALLMGAASVGRKKMARMVCVECEQDREIA